MAYRSRLDIQSSILQATRTGEAKTRIMYKANLSYLQITSYLQHLTGAGFMEYDSRTRLYWTSARGQEFVDSYHRLCNLIDGPPTSTQELCVRETAPGPESSVVICNPEAKIQSYFSADCEV